MSAAAAAGRPGAGWANDPSHSQARAWLDSGWRVVTVDLSDGSVRFEHQKERRTQEEDSPFGVVSPTLAP